MDRSVRTDTRKRSEVWAAPAGEPIVDGRRAARPYRPVYFSHRVVKVGLFRAKLLHFLERSG
jgi:hypothetical protein